MKKLLALVVVLAVTAISSATTIGLVNPGTIGTAALPMKAGDSVILNVVASGPLTSYEGIVSVAGAEFSVVSAISVGAWNDIQTTANRGYLGLTSFATSGGPSGVVATVTIKFDGAYMGKGVATLVGDTSVVGGSYDAAGNEAQVGGAIDLYCVPEPVTMSLLGLGGLFLARRRA